jgi:putative ABC transport system permease protein
LTQEGRTYTSQDTRPNTRVVSVTPEFFPLFGAGAQSGRLFGPEDRADSEPVAIVNARFVERFLRDQQPLGQRIRFGNDEPWRRIVGVVPNLWVGGLDAPVTDRNPAGVYLPVAQSAPQSLMVVARTKNATPLDLSETVRSIAFRLDPDVPVDRVRTMPQVIDDSSWFYAWGASIMGVCGLSALLLATIGLFGVVAFSVGRRVREFGIRLAVGATPANVILLVLRQSALQVVIGLVVGLTLALVLGRGVSSLMFLVQPNDPAIITIVALLLTGIALLAAYAPARRAARIDPLTALREE